MKRISRRVQDAYIEASRREGLSQSYLRLDVDRERGKVSLESDGIGRQRPREVDEALGSSSHTGQPVSGAFGGEEEDLWCRWRGEVGG